MSEPTPQSTTTEAAALLRRIATVMDRYIRHADGSEFEVTVKDDLTAEEQLDNILSQIHPADLADLLERLESQERAAVLSRVDPEIAAGVLEELDEYEDQAAVLRLLDGETAAAILDEMSSDDLVDMIGDLSQEQAGNILDLLEDEEAQDVRQLLAYSEDTAGGIMTTEYIAFRESMTAGDAIEELRERAPDAETIYYIYVTNDGGELTGVVSLRELIVSDPRARLRDIMAENVIRVRDEADQEEVARVVSHYDLLAIPVVGADDRLLGIITFDDIIDVFEAEATEDIYRLHATLTDESDNQMTVDTPLWIKTRRRLPWLVILLFAQFLTGTVMSTFEGALEAVVVLAYFVPVLMATGGNVGTQSLAVAVRGLALGVVDAGRMVQVLLKELQVGAVLGIILGVIIALMAMVWQANPMLGLVVGVSMALTVPTAAVMGTLIPLLFNRVGVDSAVASGPFITSVVDITGLIIYFSIATALLHQIV